jgi:regulator of protease activity HflC (stomatin/prohibitin superfamily)
MIPPFALLRGDDGAAVVIVALAAVVGALVGVKGKFARIRRRKLESGEEKREMYIPITSMSGSSRSSGFTQPGGAAAHIHPIAVLWFAVWMIIAVVALVWMAMRSEATQQDALVLWGLFWFVVLMAVGFTFLFSLKVADQWDRVIVLRLGKFHAVRQPGVFWLVPFVDTVAKWIDTRVHTTDLTAEETLTKDTVPVDVDAIMFWLVYDPKKAALEVEKYENAVTWAAQTALRDLIGKTMLAELLVGRDVLDKQLQEIIDARTEPWGVSVQSVEIREIKIPGELQDTMSRQAQAERERQARVILGESEKQIAKSFAEAAEMYVDNPTALHLRAMNMLFEGLKEKGSLMIIPSSAIDSMNIGVIGGLAALGKVKDDLTTIGGK